MEEESRTSPAASGDCLRWDLSSAFNRLLRKRRVLVLTPDPGLFLASVPTFREHLPPGARGIPRGICLDGGNTQYS